MTLDEHLASLFLGVLYPGGFVSDGSAGPLVVVRVRGVDALVQRGLLVSRGGYSVCDRRVVGVCQSHGIEPGACSGVRDTRFIE